MSAPIDPSLSPDTRTIVAAIYALRDAVAANNTTLERIADALAGKVPAAPSNGTTYTVALDIEGLDRLILDALTEYPDSSVDDIKETLDGWWEQARHAFADVPLGTIRERLAALAKAGDVVERNQHWDVVE